MAVKPPDLAVLTLLGATLLPLACAGDRPSSPESIGGPSNTPASTTVPAAPAAPSSGAGTEEAESGGAGTESALARQVSKASRTASALRGRLYDRFYGENVELHIRLAVTSSHPGAGSRRLDSSKARIVLETC